MIRYAEQSDLPEMYRMLTAFGEAASFPLYHGDTHCIPERLVKDRLLNVMQQGIALVNPRSEQGLSGMLLAVIADDFWKPESKFVHELAWWVDPDSRQGSTGYRLLHSYQNICEDLMDRGVVDYYTISTLTDSPLNSLETRGWAPLQTTWRRGL